MATICKHHVLSSMSGLGEQKRHQSTLLTQAGINPSSLTPDNARVHTDQVARLFQLVMLTLNDEFMGFTEVPCKMGTFALMSDLIPQCLTLKDQLKQTARFYNLTHPNIEFDLKEYHQDAVLSISLTDNSVDRQHFLREFLMVIWHRFPSWLIGEPIALRSVEFSFARPDHESELNVMFPASISYWQNSNRLIFDRRYLSKPITRTRSEIQQFVRRSPYDIMTIPGREQTLESQIERLLAPQGADRMANITLNDVAEQLFMSPQTIQRRLSDLGTSFNTIRENWRRERAIKLLQNSQISIEGISERLGFSEARSFTRAFKTWTGLSPRKYRQMFF
jgi:AraC-like DNA-binding protein